MVQAPQVAINRATAVALRELGAEYRAGAWVSAGELHPEQVAPEQRAEIGRLHAHADGLEKAADRVEECGRAWMQHECRNGHVAHTPVTCGRSHICPHCAQRASERMQRIYIGRVLAALSHHRPGVKVRRAVFPLRQGELEDDDVAFDRCMSCAKRAYRLIWGVPRRGEWGMYFALFPVTGREIERAGGVNVAKARRREKVKRLAKDQGAVLSFERGGKSMNPHVHMTVVGRWCNQRDLSAAWLLVTGDSSVADIRAADPCRLHEGLKYVSKFTGREPAELVRVFDALLIESGDRVRSRRRVEALGVLRGKVAGEDDYPPLVCDRCGAEMHAVGMIEPGLWEMGVRLVPEAGRFRGRAPP